MRLTSCAFVAFLLSAVSLLGWADTAKAAQFYPNGNNINLAAGRSNVFSTGGSIGGNGLRAPTVPSYSTDFRASTSPFGPYWQVNFPTAYQVSKVYVETYSGCCNINSLDVQTTTNGTTWLTQSSPTLSGSSLNATFSAVPGVVGVRLVSTSSNDGYPGIFRAVRITGPNTLAVNDAATPAALGKSEFSITQNTWNGGSVQSAPGWAGYSGGPTTVAIDDFTTTPFDLNGTIFRFGAGDPAPIDILLNDNYVIDSVSIAAGTDGRHAPLVDISYSPDAFSSFIPIPAATSISLTSSVDGYYVIPLGGLYDARRIRYDFSSSGGGETFVAELNAFAVFSPVPEPSTLALLGLGAIGLAIRTRRRRIAA